jgi:hypothetical protein
MYVPTIEWLHEIAQELIGLHLYKFNINSDHVVVLVISPVTGGVISKTRISFQAWQSEVQCEAYIRRLLPVLDGQFYDVSKHNQARCAVASRRRS